jgi:hypothetical protein
MPFKTVATDLDMAYFASGRHFHLSSLFLHKALQPGLPTNCSPTNCSESPVVSKAESIQSIVLCGNFAPIADANRYDKQQYEI